MPSTFQATTCRRSSRGCCRNPLAAGLIPNHWARHTSPSLAGFSRTKMIAFKQVARTGQLHARDLAAGTPLAISHKRGGPLLRSGMDFRGRENNSSPRLRRAKATPAVGLLSCPRPSSSQTPGRVDRASGKACCHAPRLSPRLLNPKTPHPAQLDKARHISPHKPPITLRGGLVGG